MGSRNRPDSPGPGPSEGHRVGHPCRTKEPPAAPSLALRTAVPTAGLMGILAGGHLGTGYGAQWVPCEGLRGQTWETALWLKPLCWPGGYDHGSVQAGGQVPGWGAEEPPWWARVCQVSLLGARVPHTRVVQHRLRLSRANARSSVPVGAMERPGPVLRSKHSSSVREARIQGEAPEGPEPSWRLPLPRGNQRGRRHTGGGFVETQAGIQCCN